MSEHKDYADQLQNDGSIKISDEVIASIAALAVADVPGVAGLAQSTGVDIGELLGKKTLSRGVRVNLEDDGVTVDLFVLMKYGTVVHDAARKIQDETALAVESMTGLHVKAVNVTVSGVSFEKESKKTAE